MTELALLQRIAAADGGPLFVYVDKDITSFIDFGTTPGT